LSANLLVMQTLTANRAFVNANKSFLSTQLTKTKINSLSEGDLDALVQEIRNHADFTEPVAVVAPVATSTVSPVGVTTSDEFGALLNLPYAGRSRKGFKFTYGDTNVYCNDSRLFAIESKLEVGTIMPFKADSLESLPYGGFSARLNYSASEIISSVNQQIEGAQSKMETSIKERMLILGVSRKVAEEQVHSMYTQEMDKKFKANMPKIDLFN
jgi:hypothetical protein